MSEEIANLLELVTAGEWGNNQGTPGGVDTGVIRSANFTKDHQFNTKEIVVRSIEERKRQKKMLQHGDILIEKSGGSPDQPVGRVLFYDLKGEHTCSNFISILRPTQQVDPKFLYYSLCNLYGRGVVKNYQQQTTGIINLQLGEYLRETIYHPPLPEQKKIAEILSAIDKAIEKLLLLSSKNKYLAKAIQEKAELRTGSGRKEKLHDVCELITKGATPTTYGHKLLSSRFPDAVSFLGGGNASPEGYFVHGSERFCTSEATQSLRRSALKERDTLVTIVGYVGNTCLIPPEILPANINQNVALVRADANHLESEYLNLFLRTEGGRRLAQIATTQAQPSVSLKQVGDLEIYLPPIEEQVLATKQADAFCKIDIQLGKKLNALQELKSAMASDLLSGRKRVSV